MELNDFDKNMSAATFAEAGEFDTARSMVEEESGQRSRQQPGRKKPVGGMLVFGAISLASYILLITNQQLVTETYTMGGWHTVFPVGTAFFFSFVHGAFASNLLSVLGIEAKK